MLTVIARFIVNLIYKVNGTVSAYAKKNPGDDIVFAGAAKGVIYEISSDVERSVKWVTARRAVLLLTKQAIIHGNLRISLKDVKQAEIILFNSFLTKGMVLRINTTDEKQHQFGITFDESLLNQKSLELTVSNEKVKHSPLSILARILLVVIIVREIYLRFIVWTN